MGEKFLLGRFRLTAVPLFARFVDDGEVALRDGSAVDVGAELQPDLGGIDQC